MIKMAVNTTALLHWARYLKETPARSKKNIARSLNAFGEGVVRNLTADLSERTGLDPEQLRSLLVIHEASPQNLNWTLDASRVQSEMQMPAPRHFPGQRSNVLRSGMLVNIITQGDEKVCPLCQEAAKEGPYDYETAKKMLPIHPNCRCLLWQAEPMRRVPVQFEGRPPPGVQRRQTMTLKSLAEHLRDENIIQLRAK